MIIAGAGGHARELLGILAESGEKETFLFDDVSPDAPATVWGRFRVLRTADEAKAVLAKDPAFIIGVGRPAVRKLLYEKMIALGGDVRAAISPFARIGVYNVQIGPGVNIMTGAVVTQDIQMGTGCLVHCNVTVHHDCRIGDFCELSPGCHILGNVTIGDLCSIGAGSVLLPGVAIGEKAVIGAGAVVTRNVAPGCVVKGIPAK
ncbi:MAG TPA: NeuD/PglB/VioB family sugar acetyltransferase [Puia sp.]|jgi:sugar O-acyltransferase (sialic acid O-acetyltransferase NeuD family)|nr:NeuD/PglB/VioB family sugar acetyltransferase [Puia sp.]